MEKDKKKMTSSELLSWKEFETLTPKQIVKELDKFIIGQKDAKKAVAIALRNRARRRLLDPELRDEVAPKNIIMIGPTGVGKTEIAKRLSNLAGAPFIKVEATKYTEVGYVGRDVESMIRDLINVAVNMLKKEMKKTVEKKAYETAEEKILDLLLPPIKARPAKAVDGAVSNIENEKKIKEQFEKTRERLRENLKAGRLEDKHVEISVREMNAPFIEIFSTGLEDIDINFQNAIGGMLPKKTKRKKLTIEEARKILANEESEKLIDMDKVVSDAVDRVENMGVVFLDEIDKIVGRDSKGGPDVSREGVQRDILPIVEGSTVTTKYGAIKTDHILFIAAGAFHTAKPSELIPELQGRFPIRVELQSLSEDDFKKILIRPKNALVKQYKALLATEEVELVFKDSSIDKLAEIAHKVNAETENIGARRLHTIMEKLLEDVSFNAPALSGQQIVVDAKYVETKLSNIVTDMDLSRYIL